MSNPICLPCLWHRSTGQSARQSLTGLILWKEGQCSSNSLVHQPSRLISEGELFNLTSGDSQIGQFWYLYPSLGKIKEGSKTLVKLAKKGAENTLEFVDVFHFQFNINFPYFFEVDISNCDSKESYDVNDTLPPEITVALKFTGVKEDIGRWFSNSFTSGIYYSSTGKIRVDNYSFLAPKFFLNDKVGCGYSSASASFFFTLNGFVVFYFNPSNAFSRTVHNAAIISNIPCKCRFKYSIALTDGLL